MKKTIFIGLTIFIFIFTGCATRNELEQTKASTESEIVLAESEQEHSVEETDNSNEYNSFAKIQGKVIALGDKRLSSSSDSTTSATGTNEDLDLWYDTIEKASDKTISYLLVNNMNQTEQDLSADNIASIMSILKNTKMDIFTELGNPATGGGYHIIALDSEENQLWSVFFDGYWFSVALDGKAYIFNGEDSGLDEISSFIPEDPRPESSGDNPNDTAAGQQTDISNQPELSSKDERESLYGDSLMAVSDYLNEKLSEDAYFGGAFFKEDRVNTLSVWTKDKSKTKDFVSSTLTDDSLWNFDSKAINVEYLSCDYSMSELNTVAKDLRSHGNSNLRLDAWVDSRANRVGCYVDKLSTSLRDYIVEKSYNDIVYLNRGDGLDNPAS